MPFLIVIGKWLLEFWGAHWGKILVIIAVVGLFFAGRAYILHAIAQHDAAIVKAEDDRLNAEWQAKLDAAKKQLLEEMDNVRKKNETLKRAKPRNMRDTIKLLRDHRLAATN